MLIKKSYGDKQKRHKQRNWQLQMMDREFDAAMATANQDAAEQDYQEFLDDLEEDKSYRKNVNIYFSELVTMYNVVISRIHSHNSIYMLVLYYSMNIVAMKSILQIFIHHTFGLLSPTFQMY